MAVAAYLYIPLPRYSYNYLVYPTNTLGYLTPSGCMLAVIARLLYPATRADQDLFEKVEKVQTTRTRFSLDTIAAIANISCQAKLSRNPRN